MNRFKKETGKTPFLSGVEEDTIVDPAKIDELMEYQTTNARRITGASTEPTDREDMKHALGLMSRSKAEDGSTVYEIIASTSEIDRDREIIEVSAWKESLPRYLKTNPTILWAHNYRELPVARAISGHLTDVDMRLRIVFDEDERSQIVRAKFDSGSLNAFSVGFIVLERLIDEDEIMHFTKVELLEVSAVPVPANAGATILRETGDLALIGKSLIESWSHANAVDEIDEGDEPNRLERKRTFAEKRLRK